MTISEVKRVAAQLGIKLNVIGAPTIAQLQSFAKAAVALAKEKMNK